MGFDSNSESDAFPTGRETHEPNALPPVTNVAGDDFASPNFAGHDSAGQHLDNDSDLAEPRAADLQGDVQISKEFWKLDQRNIRVDRIAGLIFSAILLSGALTGLLFLWLSIGLGLIWFSLFGVAMFIVLLAFVFSVWWPTLSHHNTSWRLDDEGLQIRHGVLWKHQVIIPLGRVQHADVSQGPLQRQFGVGTLTIHTAGTQHASVPLEGLTHETAIQLRDMIVHQKKDQHVV